MSKLSSSQRNSLPASSFAGPGRSYPVEDKSHAANAKARASEEEKKGKLSAGAEAKIDAKADKVLGEGATGDMVGVVVNKAKDAAAAIKDKVSDVADKMKPKRPADDMRLREGKSLWKILGENADRAPVADPQNPGMLPEPANAAQSWIDKNLINWGKGGRVTDIDKSTLDDKLFRASNIKQAGYQHAQQQESVVVKVYEAIDTNAGEDDLQTAKQVDSNSKEDMDAFDQFGPKTRNALNYQMPVKWSSAKTLDMMKQQGMDPQHPAVDSQLASQLNQHGKTISSQLRMESLVEEVSKNLKKAEKEQQLKKLRISEGTQLIQELASSKKNTSKPQNRKTGYPDDQDCEACFDRTFDWHDKALARGKVETTHYGINQDFGPDKSSISSATTGGKLTTIHDHGSGRITHNWEGAKTK